MSETNLLDIGKQVPDFTLSDHKKDKFILSEENDGKRKILLSFHPLAWTPVCTQQMKDLEDNYEKFLDLNVIPVGISVDATASKAAWAKDMGIIKTRLLADFWPHGEVAQKYGIFRQEGFSERAVYIIDEKGKIIFHKLYDIPQVPDLTEIFDFLKKEEK